MAYDMPPAAPSQTITITTSMIRMAARQLCLLHLRPWPSTKDDCRPEDAFLQVHRALYETAHAPGMAGCSIRDKPVIVNGIEVPRFTKITVLEVIARLAAIKARVYPDAYRHPPGTLPS